MATLLEGSGIKIRVSVSFGAHLHINVLKKHFQKDHSTDRFKR